MSKSPNICKNLSIHRTVHPAAVMGIALTLGGCAVMGGNDVDSLYKLAVDSLGSSKSVSLEEASGVPYASIGLRLGGSTQIMLLLASDSDNQQIWTSASRIAISTRDGRIERTSGLSYDLGAMQSLRIVPVSDGMQSVQWIADFPELHLFGIPVRCEGSAKAEETITILGYDLKTMRYEERCRAQSDQINWSFKNTFWKNPDNGFVWKSVQHVNPKLDPIEIEILRPPA